MGGLLLAALLAAIAISLSRLGRESISPTSLLWIGLMLLALPLTLMVVNRLFGLLSVRYRLDRDGLYIQWGLTYEQVPMVAIRSIRRPDPSLGRLRPRLGFWWPGCLVGSAEVEQLGAVEFFAASGPLTLVELDQNRYLAITPPDLDAFRAGYSNALHMGALERIAARSERPEALLQQIWSNRLARAEIMVGLAIPLLLLVGLIVRAPALPAQVSFGYGEDAPLVPLGRLTLLPMIGGLVWLTDLLAGSWLYRSRRDWPLAHALWSSAGLIGLLLVGATLQLISQ